MPCNTGWSGVRSEKHSIDIIADGLSPVPYELVRLDGQVPTEKRMLSLTVLKSRSVILPQAYRYAMNSIIHRATSLSFSSQLSLGALA